MSAKDKKAEAVFTITEFGQWIDEEEDKVWGSAMPISAMANIIRCKLGSLKRKKLEKFRIKIEEV